jgi:hypothetical protein
VRVLSFLFAIATCAVAVRVSTVSFAAQAPASPAAEESTLLKGFASIEPIDAHTHMYKDDPELNRLIRGLNLRSINICVIDDRDPDFNDLEPQRTEALKVRQSTEGRAAFCTTFNRTASRNRTSARARFASSTGISRRAP